MSKRWFGVFGVGAFVALSACGGGEQQPAASPGGSSTAAPADPPGPSMDFTKDKPEAAGKLAPEEIQKVVRGAFGSLKACYETGLKANPKLAGTVTAHFVIGAEGKVTKMEDQASTLSDASVVKCVEDGIAKLEFPKPEGGVVKVTYPIKFEPSKPFKERVVGTWQFDFSGDRKAAVEAELKKKAGKDDKKFAKLMKEAEDEAAKSYFEFTADSVASHIGDKVLFKLKYAVVKEDDKTFVVKVTGKPEGTQKVAKDGQELVMVGEKGMISFKDDDTMVMTDPKKGELVYKRKK